MTGQSIQQQHNEGPEKTGHEAISPSTHNDHQSAYSNKCLVVFPHSPEKPFAPIEHLLSTPQYEDYISYSYIPY